jgi:hypothetical protein
MKNKCFRISGFWGEAPRFFAPYWGFRFLPDNSAALGQAAFNGNSLGFRGYFGLDQCVWRLSRAALTRKRE